MKSKKNWLLLSFFCILSGMFFLIGGMLCGGIPGFYLDKSGIHTTGENAGNMMKIFEDSSELEAFDSLELNLANADLTLIPSDHYAIEYRTAGISEAPVCRIENGTLFFREHPQYSDPRVWFLYTGPVSGYTTEPIPESYYVNIEFPAGKSFSKIDLFTEAGDISLPALLADTLKIRSEYGDVSLDGCSGQNLHIRMESGDLSLGPVRAEQAEIQNEYGELTLSDYSGTNLSIRAESGDLSLGSIQADDIQVLCEYGNVLIQQAVSKRFTADLDSGSFLADSMDTDALTIRDAYGDVQVRLSEDLAAYGYELHTDYGFIRMGGSMIKSSDDNDEVHYSSGGEKMVDISCESGNIVIESK